MHTPDSLSLMVSPPLAQALKTPMFLNNGCFGDGSRFNFLSFTKLCFSFVESALAISDQSKRSALVPMKGESKKSKPK